MPVAARPQAFTVEDKFELVGKIISKMHNKADAQFLLGFIHDICTRYIDISKELDRVLPNEKRNKFESDFIERIIKEFNLT